VGAPRKGGDPRSQNPEWRKGLTEPQRGEPEARAVTKTQQKRMPQSGSRRGLKAARRKYENHKCFKLNSASWTRTALCLPFACSAEPLSNCEGATYITFDVPGAAPGCCQGTQPYAISVTGRWSDVHNRRQRESRFLRTPGGAIVKFDPPGASTTFVYSINLEGTIVGEYYDEQGGDHGFIRSPSGTITPFDLPGPWRLGYPLSTTWNHRGWVCR